MRSPVLALAYPADHDALLAAVRDSAAITHQHPQAIAGATLVATATQKLLANASRRDVLDTVAVLVGAEELAARLAVARSWLLGDATPAPRDVAHHLGNGSTAATSCVTALYLALRHLDRPFDQLIDFAASCRGDTDTIGAMAGALWGAANGAASLPQSPLEARGLLETVALRLHAFALGERN